MTDKKTAKRTAATVIRPPKGRAGILRGFVLLTLVGVLFAFVAVWHRDTRQIQKALEILGPYRRTVQAALDNAGRLPLKLPATDPAGKPLPANVLTYLPIDDVRAFRHFDGPLLVGHSKALGNGLKADGRAALIVDQGQCRAQWITHAEFAEWGAKQRTWLEEHRGRLGDHGAQLP